MVLSDADFVFKPRVGKLDMARSRKTDRRFPKTGSRPRYRRTNQREDVENQRVENLERLADWEDRKARYESRWHRG